MKNQAEISKVCKSESNSLIYNHLKRIADKNNRANKIARDKKEKGK